MQTPGVLIADADLPGAGELPVDGQIALLCVAKLELFSDRQHEGQQGMVVEETVASTNYRFAVAHGIPSEAEARSDVVVVARNAFDDAQSFFRVGVHGRGGREERRNLDVISQAEVQGELARCTP